VQCFNSPARNAFRGAPDRQRGIVMFVALILLLVLTLLGVALARMQTVEERLAQNDSNHQLAMQTAEAALQAAYDADAGGLFSNFTGTAPGLATVATEMQNTGTTLGYNSTWSTPGVNTIVYNGAALASAPAAANPQYVIEQMPTAVVPGCNLGNAAAAGNQITIHRITAHANGGDGTASATVQIYHITGC
jgi:type IV pilus assembly protein PilX